MHGVYSSPNFMGNTPGVPAFSCLSNLNTITFVVGSIISGGLPGITVEFFNPSIVIETFMSHHV